MKRNLWMDGMLREVEKHYRLSFILWRLYLEVAAAEVWHVAGGVVSYTFQ